MVALFVSPGHAVWNERAVQLSAEVANNYLNEFRRAPMDNAIAEIMRDQADAQSLVLAHPEASWFVRGMIWLNRQRDLPLQAMFEKFQLELPKEIEQYGDLSLTQIVATKGGLVVSQGVFYHSCGSSRYAENLRAVNYLAATAGAQPHWRPRTLTLLLLTYMLFEVHHPFNVLHYSSCSSSPLEERLCMDEDLISCKQTFEDLLHVGDLPVLPDALKSYALELELVLESGIDLATLAKESVVESKAILEAAKRSDLNAINELLVNRIAIAGARIGNLLGANSWFEGEMNQPLKGAQADDQE